MGAGQSDLYEGTYGDDPENIPDALKGHIKMPKDDSQLKHIMGERDGHLPDAPENRKLLEDLANNLDYFKGKDKYGNDWHIRMNDDGTQDWVRHQNMVINEGGRNQSPIKWNDKTGLYRQKKRRWEDE